MGRHTEYNDILAAEICERIANGESLRSISRDETMPAQSTIFKWLIQNEKFAEQYAYAREAQADTLADEIIDIADDSRNDWVEKHSKDGEADGYALNGDHVTRSKLRVDARKWVASKLKPKKYGERVQQEHTGAEGTPLIPADPSANRDIARRIAYALAIGAQAAAGDNKEPRE